MKAGFLRRTNAAIGGYQTAAKDPDNSIDSVVVDLLVDLMHRAGARPGEMFDYQFDVTSPHEWLTDVADRAQWTYDAEVQAIADGGEADADA